MTEEEYRKLINRLNHIILEYSSTLSYSIGALAGNGALTGKPAVHLIAERDRLREEYLSLSSGVRKANGVNDD